MSDSTQEEFFITTFFTVLAVLIAFIVAVAIQDGEGRKDWQHFGSIPVGAQQINDKTYILANGVQPSSICSNSRLRHDIKTSIPIDGGKRIFLICNRDQSWNDHRAMSVNFAHAIPIVIKSPLFIVPSALWLALWSLVWIVPWRREVRANTYRERIDALGNDLTRKAEKILALEKSIRQLQQINSSKCECGRVTLPEDYLCGECRKVLAA